MGLSVFPAASGGGTKKYSLTCNSSTTWTAPAGVTLVDAVIVGGGGGGGYSAQTTSNTGYNFPSGGGAGGTVTRKSIDVVPGTTYTVTVGAGGAGGVASSSGSGSSTVGQSGGTSSFAWTYNLLNGITNGAREFSNSGWKTGQQNSGSITSPPTYASYDSSFGNTSTDINSTFGTISGISIGSNTPQFVMTGIYPSGVSTNYAEATTIVSVAAGTQYTASAYFVANGTSNSCNVGVTISWYSNFPASGSGLISNSGSGSSSVTGSAWSRKSVTATAPSGTTHALIRFQAFSPSDYGGGARFTGAQLETGASATTYKNYQTTGSQIVPGTGVVTTLTGGVALGGGGGQSFYWSSVFDGIGYGGGATATDAGYYGFGGNGAGAGGPIGSPYVIPSSNTQPYYSGLRTVQNGLAGAFAPGGAAIVYDSGGKIVIQPNGAPATFDGFGAGGMGAFKSSSYAGQVGTGGGPGTPQGNGNNGVANTGGGGSGACCYESAAGYYFNGGSGGSGTVILSWMGAQQWNVHLHLLREQQL